MEIEQFSNKYISRINNLCLFSHYATRPARQWLDDVKEWTGLSLEEMLKPNRVNTLCDSSFKNKIQHLVKCQATVFDLISEHALISEPPPLFFFFF